jgi:NodT family efflux transporter outer membrane factor (OMF) lipoprotein
MKTRLVFVLLMIGLAGCAAGPEYRRPAMSLPAAWSGSADWKVAAPGVAASAEAWWKVYQDADLDRLMTRIDTGNQDLRVAEARYRQATAAVRSARAGALPTLLVPASVSRAQAAARGGPVSSAVTSHSVSLQASWEADLWGRIRRGIESAEATSAASASDLAAVRLSLQAELASTYFQLRVTDAQRELLEDTVAAYRRSLELTRNRYRVGVVGKADVVQAETQLTSAEAQLIETEVQRKTLTHAIAALLGEAPGAVTVAARAWRATLPATPLGVPSHLLERRPDIAAAERRVAAANAQIGIAEAAFFPTLTLSGALGFNANSLSHWISAPNRFWSLGPALAATLLDGGRRAAASEQAAAAYDQAVASYRGAVLEGLQQVEDNLATLVILEREAEVQEKAVRAARESVQLTTNQYKAGTVSYLSVIAVQTAQYSNERTAVNLTGRRLAASVALIRALGGGWTSGG